MQSKINYFTLELFFIRTFLFTQDGLNLCYGDKFSEAYNTFSDFEQLIAIGINCTSPYYIESLIKSTKNRIKPFIVYPNDGSIWDFERRR